MPVVSRRQVAPRGDDVGTGAEQLDDVVDLRGGRHVEDAVGTEGDDRCLVGGGRDPDGPEAAELACVDALLGGVVDEHAHQLERWMPDHLAQ